MKKVWAKILFLLLIPGVFLLGYGLFFNKAAFLTRMAADAPMAVLIGGAILISVTFLAKKTGVQKELDKEIDDYRRNSQRESALEAAEILNCRKCCRSFLGEDLRGFICPECGSELSPGEYVV